MKIWFARPFKFNIRSEMLKIYNALKERNDVILTDSFDEADYMIDFRNCYHMTSYNINKFI